MNGGEKRENISRKAAFLALFTAAAALCSYIETFIPISPAPIPGFKIGLANTVIMLVLYRYDFGSALTVNIARSLISALLFSGPAAAVFSLCGGTLAIIAMQAVKRCRRLSIYSAGVAGAAMHNIGQLLAAAVMLRTLSVFAYFPWLMVCSVICGILTALAAALCQAAFEKLTRARI